MSARHWQLDARRWAAVRRAVFERDGYHCAACGGAGGAIGFADPDAGLGFAYAPNHMYSAPGISPRLSALVDALYEALA